MVGSLSVVTTAVSWVKVAMVDPGEAGKSAVYSRYNSAIKHCLVVHLR
jgi:hypothetical protein